MTARNSTHAERVAWGLEKPLSGVDKLIAALTHGTRCTHPHACFYDADGGRMIRFTPSPQPMVDERPDNYSGLELKIIAVGQGACRAYLELHKNIIVL